MKKILLCLFCVVLYGNTNAQTKVVDFCSAMTSAPIGKKTLIMNVVYNEDRSNTLQKKWIKSKKPTKSIKHDYALMGKIIDSLKFIDYKSDTLYVLSSYYVPNGDVSHIYKTQKDTFYLVEHAQKKYQIQYVDMDKDYSVWDKYQKDSDSLLYKAIFSWNINMFIQLTNFSGRQSGGEYITWATRIILKNNKILSKEIIHFESAVFWRLGSVSD